MEKFVIIDGNSLVNRAYFALPPMYSNGQNYNAVYGVVNILAKLMTENKPDYLCVTFDAGRITFRNELYPEYKATRKGMPEDLATQMPILKELLKKMNIFTLEKKGVEADDLIGTLTRKFDDIECIVVTGDRDSLQLINSKTTVWLTKKGVTDIAVMDVDNLRQTWNLSPEQIIDLKALMGDASDNIPGVAGIGEKTAMSLLNDYQNIDNIYKNVDNLSAKLKEKLLTGAEICRLSYDLATIRCDIPIEVSKQDIVTQFPWNDEVYQILADYKFKSIIKREDLFCAPQKIAKTEIVRVPFDSLAKMLKSSLDTQYFALYLGENCVHFAVDNKTEYVVDLLGISVEMCIDAMHPILSNPDVTLLTYSVKQLYHIAHYCQIDIKCRLVDIPIAIYLLNSNIKNNPEKILEYYDKQENAYASALYDIWTEVKQDLEKSNLLTLYNDMEFRLIKVLYEMEKNGILLDQKVLNEIAPIYKQRLNMLTEKIYRLADTKFNINSPKQLSKVLFEDLGLPNLKKGSTSVDVLESLKKLHPIISEILEYRSISKLNSTYIEGIRPYIATDGRVHTQFNQTVAVTGRLSSNEPNLQNIPVRTEDGKEIRKMFIAPAGNVLLSADYSQIELRLLAHFSQDPVLLEAYQSGKDIHTITASLVFKVPKEQVTPLQRRRAKAVNFGIIYGISPYGLARDLDISPIEAKGYIDRYFETYPTIKEFLDSSVQQYKETNKVNTLFGRIRTFENVVPKGHDAHFGERAAMNMPLQGTASDIIKLAMLRLYQEMQDKKLKSRMILQVHDELILEVIKEEIEEVKTLVREVMENVVKLSIPLPVEIDIGPSWYDI